MLQEAGYQVKDGKVPSLFGGDQERFIRMDTLGPGYTPEDLRAVISGQKQHTPRKRKAVPTPPPKSSGNLIIDIQKKLQEGKGAGYANWAKRFNIKQMAQSLLYLQEHGLTDYEALSIRASEASSRFSQLSGEIKSAEARMVEIAVMQTQIRNYARTRKVYVDYRKAGYSKKFLFEHEADIAVHKAAKKFFDEQGIQKLPSIKELQMEYADLLAQKKQAYAAYRQAREEMKELQIAKSNIDALLKAETPPQKEPHEQEH